MGCGLGKNREFFLKWEKETTLHGKIEQKICCWLIFFSALLLCVMPAKEIAFRSDLIAKLLLFLILFPASEQKNHKMELWGFPLRLGLSHRKNPFGDLEIMGFIIFFTQFNFYIHFKIVNVIDVIIIKCNLLLLVEVIYFSFCNSELLFFYDCHRAAFFSLLGRCSPQMLLDHSILLPDTLPVLGKLSNLPTSICKY